MKRWVLAFAGVLMASTVLLGGFSGLTYAQSDVSTPLPDTGGPQDVTMTFQEALATELGISVDELQAAIDGAMGLAGQDGLAREGGPGFAGRHHRPAHPGLMRKGGGAQLDEAFAEFAAFLGVTEEQLRAEREAGLNIIEIAAKYGKSEDQLRAYLIEMATKRIDERLAAAASASEAEEQSSPVTSS
ncbi:MAG: hypothetical protein AB7V46_07730 [Thermomicrobiales bacterium]